MNRPHVLFNRCLLLASRLLSQRISMLMVMLLYFRLRYCNYLPPMVHFLIFEESAYVLMWY